jgi:hypothetical protein
MGVGAETLGASAGGCREGAGGAAGSVSVSAVGRGGTAFWGVLSIDGSMGKTEPRFLSVKTKHAVIEWHAARRTRLLLGSPGG